MQRVLEAMDQLGVESGKVSQIAYYRPELTRHTDLGETNPRNQWKRFRRSESTRVYPDKLGKMKSVWYVASRRNASGLEIELVRPLTEPNYISTLDVAPGHICHLGVRAENYGGASDEEILEQVALAGVGGSATKIQFGSVRWDHSTYSVYALDLFIPVKIIRKEN